MINYRTERINYLISKFELDDLKDIKAKFYQEDKKISNCLISFK